MHFKAKNLRIPKHPRLLFLAQNLGVLQPSKTRYNFLWDTLYVRPVFDGDDAVFSLPFYLLKISEQHHKNIDFLRIKILNVI